MLFNMQVGQLLGIHYHLTPSPMGSEFHRSHNNFLYLSHVKGDSQKLRNFEILVRILNSIGERVKLCIETFIAKVKSVIN